jgi:hypothetical protein
MRLKLSFVFLLLFILKSSAQIVLGSQVDYRQLDTFSYEVRFQVYADCRSSAFGLDSSSNMFVSGDTTLSLSPSLVSIKDISTYHDTISHCGASDTVLGILQYTYLDTVNFNTDYIYLKPDSTIRFEFRTNKMLIGNTIMCGTSDTIRTSYNYAELSLQQNVRGTYFKNEPLFLTSPDQVTHSHFLAAANNGLDNVTYGWGPSYNDSSSVVWNCSNPSSTWALYVRSNPFATYYPGTLSFPYNNPNAIPPIGIYLNSLTSELIYIPVRAGEEAVFVIEAYIWQKDSAGVEHKLGTVRREQLRFNYTSNDNNKLPEVEGPYSYSVCEESTLCFNVATNDNIYVPSPSSPLLQADSVKISWDSTLAHLGATFTVTNPTARLQTGRFCFTPTAGMASTVSYSFGVTASDNRGKYGGLDSRVFRVTVKTKVKAVSEFTSFACSPLVGVSHAVTPDTSTIGYGFSYSKEVLDSAGQSLVGISSIWLSSTGTAHSTSRRDSILGDTTGIFIIKNTVNNSSLNCPYTYYDTLSLELSTYDFKPLADTVFICDKQGDSIRLQDSWEYVLWSTGDTLATAYIDSAGAYSVELTDFCGNKFTRYFQVEFELTPNLNFRDTLMCNGDSLLYLYPDTLFHNIVWSTGYTGDSMLTTRYGGYYVDVSNHCGDATDTFFLIDNRPDAHMEQVYAACDTVLLIPVVDFGLDVETYWVIGGDTIVDSILLVEQWAVVFLSAKNRCYDYIVDGNLLIPLTAPDIRITSDVKFSCTSESTPLSAVGRYVDSAVWSTGDTGSSISVTGFGTYTVSSQNVCGLATDTAHYVKNVKPEVSTAVDSSVCSRLTFKPVVINGYGIEYFWQTNAGYVFADSIVSTQLEYIELYARNDCGTGGFSKYIKPPVVPSVDIAEDSLLICDKLEVLIKPAGNFQNNWVWSTGERTSSIEVGRSGLYFVNNSRFCGLAQDSVYVQIDSVPQAILLSDTFICEGDSLVIVPLAKQKGTEYDWSNGSQIDSLIVRNAGLYILIMKNICGSDRDSFMLEMDSLPEGSFIKERKVGKPFGLSLFAEVADSYLWSTGSTGSYINVSDTGIYWVRMTNRCGSVIDSTDIQYLDNISISKLSQHGVVLYPNPAHEIVYIISEFESIQELEVMDAQGALLNSLKPHDKKVSVNLESYKAGLYFIRFKIGVEYYWAKIVVK